MYLTKVVVDLKTAAQHRLFSNYRWHQALMRAFANYQGKAAGGSRILFRIDSRQGVSFQALALSSVEPVPAEWGHWETKEIPRRFLEYGVYRFSLRANPTVKRVVRSEDGDRKKNGRREPLRDISGLQAWIIRKGGQHGFTPRNVTVVPGGSQAVPRKGRMIRYSQVDFTGILKVTDRNRFLETVTHGIGSAKAFGFGLLALQPVTNTQEEVGA